MSRGTPANTVLVISDEHNPFQSSVYGHPVVRTPNMEQLAEDGTIFRNAYCPSPLCMPSRSAFFTGRRVHDIGVYNNCRIGLNTNLSNYGGVLSGQGVYTAYAGKVHVYDDPENLGFDALLVPGDIAYPGDTMFRRRPLSIRDQADRRAAAWGPKEGSLSRDEDIATRAVRWIQSVAPSIDRPWVLTVSFVKPHFPHHVSQDYWSMYERGDLPAHGIDEETARHPYAADLRRHFQTTDFTEEQVRGHRRGYWACVSHIDRQIGRIVETLEKSRLGERTNVIYTADHGEMLGEFGMWWKGSLYEDSARIPCIAAGPDFTRGHTVETPVDLHDVRAALFASAGTPQPGGWLGSALQQIPNQDEKRIVFSEYHGHGTRSGAFMVRQGQWKLIHYSEGPDQLFDLESDPDELINRLEEESEIAKKLYRELHTICSPDEENSRAHRHELSQLEIIDRDFSNLPHTG